MLDWRLVTLMTSSGDRFLDSARDPELELFEVVSLASAFEKVDESEDPNKLNSESSDGISISSLFSISKAILLFKLIMVLGLLEWWAEMGRCDFFADRALS